MGGGGGIDWDPRRSSMATGAGTPWSAENKTKPEAYLMGALADPVALGSSVAHEQFVSPFLGQMGFQATEDPTGIVRRNLGVDFDFGGQERVNKQADKQALAGQEAEAQRGLQAQSAANEARRRAEDQTRRTQFGTDLQTAQTQGDEMDAYSQARRRAMQARGRTLFPGFQ